MYSFALVVLEVVAVVLFCEGAELVVLDGAVLVVVSVATCVVVFAVLSTVDEVVAASAADCAPCSGSASHPIHANSIAAIPMIDKIFFIHTPSFLRSVSASSVYFHFIIR